MMVGALLLLSQVSSQGPNRCARWALLSCLCLCLCQKNHFPQKLGVYNIQNNLARSCFPPEYFCFVKILFFSFKFFPLPGYPNVSMPLPLRKDDCRFPKPHYWNFFDSAPESPPGNECELIVKRNCLWGYLSHFVKSTNWLANPVGIKSAYSGLHGHTKSVRPISVRKMF